MEYQNLQTKEINLSINDVQCSRNPLDLSKEDKGHPQSPSSPRTTALPPFKFSYTFSQMFDVHTCCRANMDATYRLDKLSFCFAIFHAYENVGRQSLSRISCLDDEKIQKYNCS